MKFNFRVLLHNGASAFANDVNVMESGKKRGERTQRLTYILLFCSVEEMRITELLHKVDDTDSAIKKDLGLLIEKKFIERGSDGKAAWYKTTEEGKGWMRTQLRQYQMLYGASYISKPVRSFSEKSSRALSSLLGYLKKEESAEPLKIGNFRVVSLS